MGKKLVYIAQATNIAKTLAFDVKPSIVVGLALHWSWVWLGFWSMACYSATPSFPYVPESVELIQPLWVLSLFSNSLGLAILFSIRTRIAPLGIHRSMPIAAAVVTAISTLVVAWPSLLPANDTGITIYIMSALLTGIGSAISFALWGELLTMLGMRQTVVYGVAATIVGSLLYFLGLAAGECAVKVWLVISAPLGMWLFWRQKDKISRHHSAENHPPDAYAEKAGGNANHGQKKGGDNKVLDEPHARPLHPRSLRKDFVALVAISLFFGTSYGLMKGLSSDSGIDFVISRDVLNIVAFLVGALAIFLTMSVFKMDFRHLTYQVALPLMAAGFVFLPLLGVFQFVGFFLHQLGYQYFYIVLWALWPALAKDYPRVPPLSFCCASMTGMQAGQLIGSIAGASAILYIRSDFELAMIATIAVFAILLVALFGFGNTMAQSGWWVARPMGEDKPASFRRTCENIAANRGLSARETEVFMLLAKGRNCGYISKQLVISEPTTKTHMRNVYRKLGIHSQQALLDLVEYENR